MPDIYEQHEKHFNLTKAFVVTDITGERVATIAIKYPRDGAGRLYAYVHAIGIPMVRGSANGYGYDKRSAAIAHAIGQLKLRSNDEKNEPLATTVRRMLRALDGMDAGAWETQLRLHGLNVLQAV